METQVLQLNLDEPACKFCAGNVCTSCEPDNHLRTTFYKTEGGITATSVLVRSPISACPVRQHVEKRTLRQRVR